MRLRFALLGTVLTALVAVAAPETANAAPVHNQGLTINAAPNPIIAGEGVLIYGQLKGQHVSGRPIRLYHRLPPFSRYSLVGITKTDQYGFYEFPRAEGVVYTNRSWFARGPEGTHSRTVYERVSALVSIESSSTNVVTDQPVMFSGHVTPNHAFDRVVLQQQRAGNEWRTLESTLLGPGSNYSMTYRFRFPGERQIRVLLRGDSRNIRSASDQVTITVQQRQIPDFTISSSQPIITIGQSATISGILYMRGTHQPEPNTPVTLCGRELQQPQFTCDTAGKTTDNGDYRFTVSPVHNEVYVVETTLPPHRHTARLLEGVRDDVTLSASPPSAQAGQKVIFTGSVTPDQAGDTVYLQRFGDDGQWHPVGITTVRPNSTFQFVRVFGTAGTKTFRARVLADQANVGGVSGPVTVGVTLPPVAGLPESQ